MDRGEQTQNGEGLKADALVMQQARYTAIVLASAMFMAGLDATVLLTAIPRMARDFGESATALSSTITIYVLVTAMLLPLSSWIAQRYGPRRIFMGAIVGFALSSVGCGLSVNLPMFLAMRALQAACGSLMAPVGNLVLLKITPKRYMVTAMAISSTPALIAPVVGPPLGGFITTFFEWPWVFFINVPIAFVGVIAAYRLIPNLPPEGRTPFDVRGFALCAGTLCAWITGLDRLAAKDSAWWLGPGLVVLGVGLAIFAIRHARTAAHPIVPLTPLRFPCFRISTAGAATFVRFAFLAQGFTIPLMLQVGLGLTAFQAGLLLLAQNAGDLILKSIASKALRLLGFRTALVSGSIMQAGALAGCSFLTTDIPFAGLMAIMFAIGAARSILFTAMMALRFADMPQSELGGATVLGNMINSATQATAISGAALLLNLLASGAHDPDQSNFRMALLILAAISAVSIPLFARMHEDTGAEVSGKARRGLRNIENAPEAN